MRPQVLMLLVVAILATVGCGGGEFDDQTTPAQNGRSETQTDTRDSVAALEQAVRDAVRANSKVSGYVLWHNRLPATAARSTAGPALAALRSSAAERRQGRLRVKTLSNDLAVRDVQLDPSYTRATALIRGRGRVRLFRNGRPLRRPVALDERYRLQLRRVGDEARFVVWKVEPSR